METSITTEHKHWYMYSDAIRYFLYVPEKLRIVMNQNDYDVADVDDYYMRKLKFLQDHHFFDKDEVCFQIELYRGFSQAKHGLFTAIVDRGYG